MTDRQTVKRTPVDGADPDVVLHLPREDVDEPEISLVVPAADEELTVGEFVEWGKQGLEQAGVAGEIVIVDSSSDRTERSRSGMARASSARPGGASGGPTSMRSRLSAAITSSWATPT